MATGDEVESVSKFIKLWIFLFIKKYVVLTKSYKPILVVFSCSELLEVNQWLNRHG